MKSTKLPKVLSAKKHSEYLLPLCEKYDGNTIILIYNSLSELIEKTKVEKEEDVFEKFVEILLYNKDYTYKKLLTYVKNTIAKEAESTYQYQRLTNRSEVTLDSILSLILMYNKAITKHCLLEKDEMDLKKEFRNYERQAYNIYPRYLSNECLYINEQIARLTEMHNITFPAAVEKMKKFDGEILFKGKKYIAETPKNIKELILEGYMMHNCLVMRGPDVARENMRIMFIRTPDKKPYIDVIMDKDYNIIWAITDYHANVEGDNRLLVENWHKKLLEKVKETAL